MPSDFSGLDIERKNRVRVERVAITTQRGRPWRGLSHTGIDQSQLRVVAHGAPRGSAQRREVTLPPALGARLTWRGNSVGLPLQFTGLRIVGGESAAHFPFTTNESDDDFAVCDQRRIGV